MGARFRDPPRSPAALVIGESLVDVVSRPDASSTVIPGGSPLNVAIGLRRLGMPVTLQTRLGNDEFGRLIERHLAADGVVLTEDSRHDQPTSVARATICADGSASYTFDIAWDTPAAVDGADVTVVHVGSLAAMLEPRFDDLRARLAELRRFATISYDPNVRAALGVAREIAARRVGELVALADVVKASSEDIAWLYPGREARAVAEQWLGAGPAVVIVTEGEAGAFAVTAAGTIHVPSPQVLVADTIGAGDSFTAGALVSLAAADVLGRSREFALRGMSTSMTGCVLDFAARCAAVTVSRDGADPPSVRDLTHADRA